jgi:hypothetical protein
LRQQDSKQTPETKKREDVKFLLILRQSSCLQQKSRDISPRLWFFEKGEFRRYQTYLQLLLEKWIDNKIAVFEICV